MYTSCIIHNACKILYTLIECTYIQLKIAMSYLSNHHSRNFALSLLYMIYMCNSDRLLYLLFNVFARHMIIIVTIIAQTLIIGSQIHFRIS